jgi:hypothetical protein
MSFEGEFPSEYLKDYPCKAIHTYVFCVFLCSPHLQMPHWVVPTNGMVVPRVMQLKFPLAKASKYNLHQ